MKTPLQRSADGNQLSFEVSSPNAWRLGVGALAIVGASAVFARRLFGGDDWAVVASIVVAGPMLLLFHRHGVELDRSAGTVTTWNRFLPFSWRSVVPAKGQAIEVERRLVVPEDRESYWVGHVYLGSTRLLALDDEQAQALGQEIATFLGVSCTQKKVDAARAQRMAAAPILLTVGLTALFVVAYGAYRLLSP